MYVYVLTSFSSVEFCATPWTVAHQVPLSMGFSRQEYWSGLPSTRGSSQHRIEPLSLDSPALAGGFFTTSATWKAKTKNDLGKLTVTTWKGQKNG